MPVSEEKQVQLTDTPASPPAAFTPKTTLLPTTTVAESGAIAVANGGVGSGGSSTNAGASRQAAAPLGRDPGCQSDRRALHHRFSSNGMARQSLRVTGLPIVHGSTLRSGPDTMGPAVPAFEVPANRAGRAGASRPASCQKRTTDRAVPVGSERWSGMHLVRQFRRLHGLNRKSRLRGVWVVPRPKGFPTHRQAVCVNHVARSRDRECTWTPKVAAARPPGSRHGPRPASSPPREGEWSPLPRSHPQRAHVHGKSAPPARAIAGPMSNEVDACPHCGWRRLPLAGCGILRDLRWYVPELRPRSRPTVNARERSRHGHRLKRCIISIIGALSNRAGYERIFRSGPAIPCVTAAGARGNQRGSWSGFRDRRPGPRLPI